MDLFVERPVLKYSKEGVFRKKYKSEAEACKKLGIDSGNLCRALHRRIQAGGFYWLYDTGEPPRIHIDIYVKQGKRVKIFKDKLYICTSCSILEASRLVNVPETTLRKHMKDGTVSVNGFKFYEDN